MAEKKDIKKALRRKIEASLVTVLEDYKYEMKDADFQDALKKGAKSLSSDLTKAIDKMRKKEKPAKGVAAPVNQ